MPATCPIGIGAPNILTVPVTRGTTTLDLTTVTGASLRVQKPDGSEVIWTASIVGTPTASELTLVHSFASGDLDKEGTWRISPVLMVPGGTIPVNSKPLIVTRFP